MSYRSSVQRAAARLSSLLGRSRGLLVAIALLAAWVAVVAIYVRVRQE